MKIVVLVKQVPRPDSIRFDEETKSLQREGVPLELNPFDAAAVKHAVRLRDAAGGEVVAMTMGPPQAEEALRHCLALGADRAIHLSDRVFAVADTLGTSRTLALAIAKEGADLVLAGRKSTDSDTWQVPPETAAFLGRSHLTNVAGLEPGGDGSVRVTREADEGYSRWELQLPAVVSVAHADADVTGPGADGRIDVWTAADLVGEVQPHDKRFGQTGSPTRVLAVRDVTPPRANATTSSVDEAAALLRAKLDEASVAASAWEKPERLGEKPGASYDCWTLVERFRDGRPRRVSLELLGKGRELAGKLGGENVALILGSGLDTAAAETARYGADRVVLVDDERLDGGHFDLHAPALVQVLRERRPHVLLVPSTLYGRDVGPRAAGELQLGMTGDCVNLGIDRAGRLIQTKPAYGGNIVSVIMGATTPQLATVRARMFDPVEPRDVAAAIERFALDDLPASQLQALGWEDADASALDEAAVVVLAGPGVPADGIDELEEICRAHGAALGGTREVCEAGLLPRNRHIGLNGRPVAPRLLVALDVPGDTEQLCGFVKAAAIVSVAGGDGMRERSDVVFEGDAHALLSAVLALA
jgi:electron transfer flavoprotein alpha/beta subunit